MFMNQNPDMLGRVDVSDLKANKIIMFQHRHYLPMAFLTAILIPGIVPWLLWDDFWGGICFAGFLKMLCVHHSTFFINSLAHLKVPVLSAQNYSDKHTSNDNMFVALATLGEGYHNFHHEFPQDYRNGVHVWQYDPTKWMIRFMAACGLAVDLIRFPAQQIEKGLLQMSFKDAHHKASKLQNRLKKIDHGPDVMELPEMSWEEIKDSVKEGNKLVIINEVVYDMKLEVESGTGVTHRNKSTVWYDLHPGGTKILDIYAGKDATNAFLGEVYKHSNAAHNVLAHLKIARLSTNGGSASD
jgi:stearoyl-CoA desaturase (delta-9 desaturase)